MYYFLYTYNYNEAKETMSVVMPDYMLAYAAVYINGTKVVDGTAFSSPLINDSQFDQCWNALSR